VRSLKLGLQLYTVREEAQKDLLGTLRRVGRMGYEGVEFAGTFGVPAAQVKAVLAETGLVPAGLVFSKQELETTRKQAFDYAHELGCTTLLFPWLDEPLRGSPSAYESSAEMLNGFGQACHEAGLRLLYHIHGYEFERYGDRTGLDILMAHLNPAWVGIELDTYWVAHGGADPLRVFLQCASRCPYLHLKDMKDRRTEHDTEVLDGVLGLAGLIPIARRAGVEWLIVEQEQFDRPPLESAAISLANLKRVVRS
jgi:sugar phosphate isomerase/epimerase